MTTCLVTYSIPAQNCPLPWNNRSVAMATSAKWIQKEASRGGEDARQHLFPHQRVRITQVAALQNGRYFWPYFRRYPAGETTGAHLYPPTQITCSYWSRKHNIYCPFTTWLHTVLTLELFSLIFYINNAKKIKLMSKLQVSYFISSHRGPSAETLSS